MSNKPSLTRLAAAALVVAAGVSTSHAQLRPEQVVVVYDSRLPDSLAVAEHYAGSAKVPGGAGGRSGTRPNVNVFNLASVGVGPIVTSDIYRSEYNAWIRNPLRTRLTTLEATLDIRCIVLTKGLPHRIYQDPGPAGGLFALGDNPSSSSNSFFAGQFNTASVDSDLTLLRQNIETGELGASGDSRSDGVIFNPYWRRTLPISAWTSGNRATAKNINAMFNGTSGLPGPVLGMFWTATPPNDRDPAAITQLSPGDIYLVCRLDGRTVTDVRAMLDRATSPTGTIAVNTLTAGFILDEYNSDGVQGPINTSGGILNGAENDNLSYNELWGGDDYEQTRDTMNADGRYVSTNIKYDALGNKANFIVGSRVSFNGEGKIIDTLASPLPILLLAHGGANSSGTSPGDSTPASPNSRTQYASSFTYAPGCVFNTIESFNGREFGDVTPGSIPQQQMADYITAGGTLGIGHVWEPTVLTLPDNFQIIRNLALGNLTWAEAAWTSIPVLSHQHVVIGDPLARYTRSSEDINADGQITINDLYNWNAAPTNVNRIGGITDADRVLVQNAARASRDIDMKGGQR